MLRAPIVNVASETTPAASVARPRESKWRGLTVPAKTMPVGMLPAVAWVARSRVEDRLAEGSAAAVRPLVERPGGGGHLDTEISQVVTSASF